MKTEAVIGVIASQAGKASSHQKSEEARDGFFPDPAEGEGPADTSISDFLLQN